MTVDRTWFLDQLSAYQRAAEGSPFPLDGSSIRPCDDRAGGATIDPHYTPMDLWAASRVGGHVVDVGSRVDGFCAHVLAGGHRVTHVDIRGPGFTWPRFAWRQDDARTLATFADASARTVTCLHAAEHVGLGRYGDDLDPDGMGKVMRALARILTPTGRLYFACPVGRHRAVFNAHRVASPAWVAEIFTGRGLVLEGFAAVDDAGVFHPEAAPADFEAAEYACGCFEWKKP